MIGKIFAAIAATVLLFVVGVIFYKEYTVCKVQINVQLKNGQDPFVVMRKIVPNDSSLIEVKETNHLQNRYLITVSTHRKKNRLIEIMRNNNKVENIEYCPE